MRRGDKFLPFTMPVWTLNRILSENFSENFQLLQTKIVTGVDVQKPRDQDKANS